jgi:hypothetical protein
VPKKPTAATWATASIYSFALISTAIGGREGLVEIEPGVFVPSLFNVNFDDVRIPAEACLTIAVGPDGRHQCRGVHIEARSVDPGLTTELLRLPLPAMTELAVRTVARRLVVDEAGELQLQRLDPEESHKVPARPVQRQRRRRITAEHLQEVARVYQEARTAPTRHVLEYFQERRPRVEYSTVAGWIMKARDAGYLDGGRKDRHREPEPVGHRAPPPQPTREKLVELSQAIAKSNAEKALNS